nr:flagellar basal body P-ring formation chaperone FlgA [uncultured Marinobacter sp.]
MRTTILPVILLMSVLSTPSQAQTSAEQIEAATSRFLAEFAQARAAEGLRVTFDPGQVDSRVALASCTSPLAVEFTGDPWKSTHPSVQVACEGERPWRMFVPVSVSIHGPALVAARPLNRGEPITGDAITTESVVLNASRRGIIRETSQALGMIVRRPVNTGSVLTPGLLEAPDAVSRGDHVIITARSGSFTVQSRGKALADAAVGEQVLVENLASSRTVKGNVVAPGQVEIPM